MCGINVPITVTGRRDPSGAGLLGLTTFHTSWIIGEPLTAIIAKVAIIPLPDLVGVGFVNAHRADFKLAISVQMENVIGHRQRLNTKWQPKSGWPVNAVTSKPPRRVGRRG
jgi:hypothetical protein